MAARSELDPAACAPDDAAAPAAAATAAAPAAGGGGAVDPESKQSAEVSAAGSAMSVPTGEVLARIESVSKVYEWLSW